MYKVWERLLIARLVMFIKHDQPVLTVRLVVTVVCTSCFQAGTLFNLYQQTEVQLNYFRLHQKPGMVFNIQCD